jgi:predicted nucleic acid-binding Zn ribbon protein
MTKGKNKKTPERTSTSRQQRIMQIILILISAMIIISMALSLIHF